MSQDLFMHNSYMLNLCWAHPFLNISLCIQHAPFDKNDSFQRKLPHTHTHTHSCQTDWMSETLCWLWELLLLDTCRCNAGRKNVTKFQHIWSDFKAKGKDEIACVQRHTETTSWRHPCPSQWQISNIFCCLQSHSGMSVWALTTVINLAHLPRFFGGMGGEGWRHWNTLDPSKLSCHRTTNRITLKVGHTSTPSGLREDKIQLVANWILLDPNPILPSTSSIDN